MEKAAGATLRELETVGSSAWRVRAASLAMGRLKSLRAHEGTSSGADCDCNGSAAHHEVGEFVHGRQIQGDHSTQLVLAGAPTLSEFSHR